MRRILKFAAFVACIYLVCALEIADWLMGKFERRGNGAGSEGDRKD